MNNIPDAYIQTANDAADLARSITLEYFCQTLHIETKHDDSPVTIADRECEQSVRTMIQSRFPDHGFIGEETGQTSAEQPWCWTVDPIDGTKCFATAIPTFGFLLALLYQSKPILGIIDHPALDQRWLGVNGQQTSCNGQLCTTSTVVALDQSTIHATTPDMFSDEELVAYNRLSHACRFRAFGGDCYLYALLASGYTALVCEADLKTYDSMALVPVIEGAGGVITDWQGDPLTLASGGRVLASANPALHHSALIQLNLKSTMTESR